MTDLARKAMEKIAESVGDTFDENDLQVLRDGINSVGVLVSHERLAELNAYEAELQVVRNIVQNAHPMGAAKHIGLRESATALVEVVGKQVVSHEDAALLREVKRIARGVEVTIGQFLDGNGTSRWSVGVLVRRDVPQRFQQYAATPQAALKSALDAAGVPDAKGAE